MSHSTPETYKYYSWALFLAVGLFLLYNSNLRHGSGVDTLPSTALPISFIKEANIDLDEFKDIWDNSRNSLSAGLAFGAIQHRNDQLLSSYPIGNAILATPYFFLADYFNLLNEWHDYRVVAKLASSSMVAATAAILFLCMLNWCPPKPSLLIATLFGAATSMWPIISQDLWQHGPGMLCLITAIMLILKLESNQHTGLAIAAGSILAMAVVCRFLNAIPAVLLALYLVLTHKRTPFLLIGFLTPALISAMGLIYFNLAVYGNLTGGYEAIYSSQWHGWRELTTTSTYSTPLLYGLGSILISPSKGLLIYSPYLLFSFFAIIWCMLQRPSPLVFILVTWSLLSILLLAKNTLWWGGTAFGSRYLAETLIPLSLLLSMAWGAISKSRTVLLIFYVLGIFSISVQAIGAYRSPCGWAETPKFADHYPERHWDWTDTQIARCFKNGLQENVTPFEIFNRKPGETDF